MGDTYEEPSEEWVQLQVLVSFLKEKLGITDRELDDACERFRERHLMDWRIEQQSN